LYIFFTLIQYILNPILSPPQRWIIGTAYPPGELEETLALPVNTSQDVLSTRKYTGGVTITILGEGQIDESTLHDAFSQYDKDANKRTKISDFRDFTIDDRNLILRVFDPLPSYDPTHKYQFLYNVGLEPRQIPFRIVNGNSQDTSVFTVKISIENTVSAAGR
jgi:hypothetical protein